MEFYKYEGAGNDFIMVNNFDGSVVIPNKEKIKSLCNRHFGIGADGIIFLESSKKGDCFMNYFNSDGTEAEMCGNGVRCTAKFFLDQKKSNLKELSIDTRAGAKKVILEKNGEFSVNMGKPVFKSKDFPDSTLSLEGFNFGFVSMGNPHAVTFVKNLSSINLPEIGPKIENDAHFPNKINVELVEKVREDYFKVKVWERGSGATLSCGSGACAVYAVLKKKNSNLKEVTLEFPGGNLYVSENKEGEIVLRGDAVRVFKGEIK